MKFTNPLFARLNTPVLLLALVAISLLPLPAHAAAPSQRREHLTPQEVEMVRDAQELDRRVALFVKMAERRLLAATGTSAVAAQNPTAKDAEKAAKEVEKWGELKGTRANYFSDLARILDEAINNIDDVAVRTPGSSLIPKAVKHLADASARILPQLTSLRSGASGDGEREALEQAIDNLQQVIDAAKKLPAETTEKKDEKKKN